MNRERYYKAKFAVLEFLRYYKMKYYLGEFWKRWVTHPEYNFIDKFINACFDYNLEHNVEGKPLNSKQLLLKSLKEIRSFKICKIRESRFRKKVTIYLMRPGVLIGLHGHLINYLTKHTGYKIKLVEVKQNPNILERELEQQEMGLTWFD